jgi:hypothetical protein
MIDKGSVPNPAVGDVRRGLVGWFGWTGLYSGLYTPISPWRPTRQWARRAAIKRRQGWDRQGGWRSP